MSNVEEVTTTGYRCKECGKIYMDKQLAELCHKHYYCEVCGKETERYWLICDSCREKKQYKEATKISYKEYLEKYPGYMIYDGSDYYQDLDELIEMYECDDKQLPKYVYGTIKERIEVNIENAIECAEEDSNCEDFSFDNTEELIEMVNKWNEKNGTFVYYVQDKLIILLTEEDFK